MIRRHVPFCFLYVVVLTTGLVGSADAQSTCPLPTNPDPAASIVLDNVHVVPMHRPEVQRDQRIVISDGRIVALGSAVRTPVPDEAVVIDGAGAYVVPGLMDMHAHVSFPADAFSFLAHGVTTVRLMWGTERQLALREAIQSGEIAGPRLLLASPGFDGPPAAWPGSELPETPEEGREAVRRAHEAGFDFIKVYTRLAPDIYAAVVHEARALDLDIVGHLPAAVGLEGALEAGQRTIEHLAGLSVTTSGQGWSGTLDEDRLATEIARIRASGVWLVPTQVVVNRSQDMLPELETQPLLPSLSPAFKAWQRHGPAQPVDWDPTEALANRARVLAALHEAGVPMMAGTDSGVRYVLPGPGLYEEMALWVDAGLDPFDALRGATTAPREYLGDLDPGAPAVAVGAPADLLLLRTNPLQEVPTERSLAGIVQSDRWWSADHLRSALEAQACTE